MKKLADGFVCTIDFINSLTKWVLIALLFSCVLASFAEVICRYVLHISVGWTDEFCRFTMIWMAFLAAGHAARQGRMVRLEVIYVVFRHMSKQAHTFFDWVSGIIAIAFYVVASLCVWIVIQRISGIQYSAAFRIPMAFMYSSIIVGCFLLILNTIAAMLSPMNESDLSDAMAMAAEVEKMNKNGEFSSVSGIGDVEGGQSDK